MLIEAGINSILQTESVTVTGDALAKIKNDPRMLEFEKYSLQLAQSDS